MDDDDGFATSDAEFDSEVEDYESESELSCWLDQQFTSGRQVGGILW